MGDSGSWCQNSTRWSNRILLSTLGLWRVGLECAEKSERSRLLTKRGRDGSEMEVAVPSELHLGICPVEVGHPRSPERVVGRGSTRWHHQ